MNLAGLIWLLLPAGVANMTPVLISRVPFLDYPIDGGVFFFGRRLFGSHKTWRGLIFGILAGSTSASLQSFFVPNQYLLPWQWGALLGFGALAGDLTKSFIKRRIGIGDGEPLWIVDQIDWIIGALLVSQPIAGWQVSQWLPMFVIGGMMHVLINILGHFLKLRIRPY